MINTDQASSPRVLVIGAGIAGMQASLDIANAGYKVLLVEKLPSIGGRMAQLSETFPTLDCSQCILTPRTVEVGHHDNIELMTNTLVETVEGNVGAFRVTLEKKPRYVDEKACIACGECSLVCPVEVPSDFERGLGPQKAIYNLFPQAVPATYIIDKDICCECMQCEIACEQGAIDHDDETEYVEIEVDAIIVATGYNLYSLEDLPEYGGGRVPDVIDALAFERILSASGPTTGKVLRPSDGKEPTEIVFIQCAGSREPERHLPHCSKICCMYSAKQAILYKHRVHGGQPYIFYIDIRSPGKRYDEFVQRAMQDENVIYLRGKVSRVFRENGHVTVLGSDTLSGEQVHIDADMVVVAPGLVPRPETRQLAEMLGISVDEQGWLVASNAEFRPVETERPGIFVIGAGVGPRDIPETVAHASASAAKVLTLLAQKAQLNET